MPDFVLLFLFFLSFFSLHFSFLIKNTGEMRRLPPRAASTSLENGCDSMMMIPDVDCDCIRRCDHQNLSMPAPALYGFFESVAASQVFLSPPQVFRPYRAAAKAWVLRAYPRSATWSSDGV